MAKTTNIFRPSDVDTFAVPVAVFNRLLNNPDVKISAAVVYAYILSVAASPTVRIYTGDALNDTGLSRPVFIEARETLIAAKLINAVETTKQGVWQYELLSENGGKLPTYEDFIVFRDLAPEHIEAYYSDRLGVSSAPEKLQDESLRFVCPFHTEQDGKNRLTVTIDRGEGLHGRFICGKNRCGRHGGLIEFEQAMAKRRGNELTKSQAAQFVRSFMVTRLRPEEDTQLNTIVVGEIPAL
jgi:hypothetical protein